VVYALSMVGRYRYEGTHTGNLPGYPATGRPLVMRSIDIWRVEHGRFVEHWDKLNILEVFSMRVEQVKLLPKSGAEVQLSVRYNWC
jgi:predicted ester cyclase